MVVEIFELTTFLLDDEDVARKITPHFGIMILVHKLNQRGKQKIPFMIIPTQEKETEEFFLDQLSKVQCGSYDSDLSFINFSFKIQMGQSFKEFSLMLIMEPDFEKKFMEIWPEVLPNSMKPSILDNELKSEQTFQRKASEISVRFEDMAEFYEEKICEKVEIMMMSLYANFMTPHVSLKKKELMFKLREEEFRKLPQFVKTNSQFTGLDEWIIDSFVYTRRHRCNLQKRKKCNKFGLKKCSQCRVARYCNTDCQNKDWKYHAAECQSWGENYRTFFLFLGDTLMDIMKRHIPGKVKLRLTFEEFTALLSAKMFELNFELITDIRFYQKSIR